MKKTIEHEWLFLLVFIAFGFVSFGAYYFYAERIARHGAVFPGYARPGIPDTGQAPAIPEADKIVLTINETKRLGKADVVYRGFSDKKTIQFDVVFPSLDPRAVYPYRVEIPSAKNGFVLAGGQYKLISAKKTHIRLDARASKKGL